MKLQYSKLLLLTLIAFSFLKPSAINAQCVNVAEVDATHPKREMRGVFIPSVVSISWPTNRFATPAVQQAELITILNNIELNGYNTVFLQVRPESDALYPTTIDPWSYWLTGAQGTAPSPMWDPLQFAIDESHSRGLELHAWLNPYRAKRGTDPSSSDHVTVEHPDWIFTASNNANLKIVNPGIPEVEDYIVSVVEDIASRYDVDGIHFDDYFYPSGGMGSNQDAQTYIDHNPTNISNINDWRRDNVNTMIAAVYSAIQNINSTDNKNVVFGVSPAGIWKSGTPPGITGNSSYSALYCDPIAWMQAGSVDYIAPQLYWAFGGGQDYDSLSQWWNDQADTYNVQVYISQAYYKMIDGNNWPASHIQDQVDENREASMDATFGHIAYRYNEIGANNKGINTALNSTQFQYKSFVAPITGTGKDALCALKPDNIRFGPLKVLWDTPAAASDGDLPQKYVVYAFDNAAQATSNKNDGTKILDIVAGNELTLTQSQIDTKFIVVTSLDKNNNEAGDFCNFPLDELTAACSVVSITAPTAKNNCSGSFTATTSTTFPIESTTIVTWNYDFGGGETFTQTQNVTIEDVTPPTVIAQDITVTLTGATTSITASDINNGSSDNCTIDTMSIDMDTFTCADIGVHPVTLTVVDKNGNSAFAIANVTVEADATEYLTGSGWTNGVPHLGSAAKITGDYSTTLGSIDACSCIVEPTAVLTIEEDDFLKIEGDITNNGTIIVESRYDVASGNVLQGSIVQVDDDASFINNGGVNIDIDTPPMSGRDFMLMGSPMSSETRADAFGGALRVRNHLTGNFTPNAAVAATSPGAGNWLDEEGDDWPVYAGTINPGEGYMVMQSLSGGPTSYSMTYDQGTLNNGVVIYNATYNGTQNASPSVIANPYASAISATDFINGNANVDAVYFWEHVTTPTSGNPGPYGLDYTMEDLSIFNLTGGTSAAGSDATTTPNGIISTGQGFGVKVTSAGDITFNNAMRRTTGNTTLRSTPTTDRDRIWLNVQANRYDLNGTALIGFINEATDGIDVGYDSRRLANNVSFYSHLADGSEQLGIQARGTFQENVKIPMGFSTLVDENISYTISIQNLEGLNLGNQTVYLIDNQEQTVTNLSNTNYTFESAKGIFDVRFTLQFTPETILGSNDVNLDSIAIYPNPTQNILNIVSPKAAVTAVEVYDVRGRVVSEVSFNTQGNYQVDLSSLESAMYFVKVITDNGSISKRVVKQ